MENANEIQTGGNNDTTHHSRGERGMKVNLMLIIASPFIALGFVWGFVVNAFLSGVETYKAIHRIICED